MWFHSFILCLAFMLSCSSLSHPCLKSTESRRSGEEETDSCHSCRCRGCVSCRLQMPHWQCHSKQSYESYVESPAQVEVWMDIMTASVHKQRNILSYKVGRKKLFEAVRSPGKSLCIPSAFLWVRCLIHDICSTWLIFLLLLRSLVKQNFQSLKASLWHFVFSKS